LRKASSGAQLSRRFLKKEVDPVPETLCLFFCISGSGRRRQLSQDRKDR